ncbi:hypothetical protein B0H14DRAFT_2844177 [Mycena olivaceomarginata]|nr:hypothetical protein B0H14DRAFT_2844177 [Mycena olivaceomarginata]
MTLAGLPWYTGVLLAVAEFFGMHHIVTRVLLNKSSYTDSVNTTPYFAGIIAGSVVWVCYAWVTRLVGREWCSLSLLDSGFGRFCGFFLGDEGGWGSVRLWDSRLSGMCLELDGMRQARHRRVRIEPWEKNIAGTYRRSWSRVRPPCEFWKQALEVGSSLRAFYWDQFSHMEE